MHPTTSRPNRALKTRLRRQALARRNGLLADTRERAAILAQARIASLPAWANARCIGAYFPWGSEYDPKPLIDTAWKEQRVVVYPRITGPGQMVFHHWSAGDPLDNLRSGVQQPTSSSRECALDEIDLFLVPLVAWDRRGQRLGYGGGFYDRALAKRRGFRLGLGFECQRIAEVPAEAHDQPLDALIHETGLELFRM